MIIGLTGYIGSGKTTSANLLKELGFMVIDADGIGHALLEREEIRDRVADEFGESVLSRSLGIDRKALGRLVFSDSRKLDRLNQIVHPLLEHEIKAEIDRLSASVREDAGKETGRADARIAVDAALFQELNLRELCDYVILLRADIEKVTERLKPRTFSEIISVMNSQKIVKKADFTLENNGTIQDLKENLESIIRRIIGKGGRQGNSAGLPT